MVAGQVIPISICSGSPMSTTSCAPCCANCARRRSRRTQPMSTSIRAFPEEALKALNAARFSAVHVPEEYGGQGADAVATCIVIEEVARVVRVLVADSGGQQAGHDGADPARLRRAEEAGAAVAGVGRGDGVVCAVGARGRQRRGGDAHPGPSRTATTGSSTAPSAGSPMAASRPGTR